MKSVRLRTFPRSPNRQPVRPTPTRAGEWKIIDFDSIISEGTEAIPNATVRYAAPEVARARLETAGVCVTRAVDVWAMGLVLFHFFSGSSLWGDIEVDEEFVATRPEEAVRLLDADKSLAEPQRRCTLLVVAAAGCSCGRWLWPSPDPALTPALWPHAS